MNLIKCNLLIFSITAFFSSVALSEEKTVSLLTDVEKITKECTWCHGKDGASTDTNIPIIGGQSHRYQVVSWKAFKNKSRPCPETAYRTGPRKGQKTDHCKIASTLSDVDVMIIATFYARQPFLRNKQKVSLDLTMKGEKLHIAGCEKCHFNGGAIGVDDSPIIKGQQIGYLNNAFKEFYSEKRSSHPKMKVLLDEHNKANIEALVNYYASFH